MLGAIHQSGVTADSLNRQSSETTRARRSSVRCRAILEINARVVETDGRLCSVHGSESSAAEVASSARSSSARICRRLVCRSCHGRSGKTSRAIGKLSDGSDTI